MRANNNAVTDVWLALGDNAYYDGTYDEFRNKFFTQCPYIYMA